MLFRCSDQFNPGDPDFDYMHQVVAKALAPHRQAPPPRGVADPGRQDACAYHPGQSY